MTRADLVAILQDTVGLSRREAVAALEATLAALKEALQQGERIQIVNFGTFHVRQKRERLGRHVQTGLAITIRPRKVVTFRPSGTFRELVRREEAS